MPSHWKILAVLALAAPLVPGAPVRAEVRHAAPAGFEIGGDVVIHAAPDEVWARLVQPDDWWSTGHRWFDGGRLTLDLRPDGCWCETGADGAGARHMTVGNVDPGKGLTLLGGLGPLQALGLDGALRLTLTPGAGGTRPSRTYVVTGYQPGGVEALAGPVDGVLAEQITRLKAAVESGPDA